MQTASVLNFDTGESTHAPELYAEVALARAFNGFADCDDTALRLYKDQGYLAIENAFSPAEVQSAFKGLDDLVMGRYADFKGIVFESKAREILPTLAIENRLDAVRKFADFVKYEPRLNALAHHPQLIALIEKIIGDKAALFQDMALIKPPRIGREKPWHQDHAYFDFPLGTPVVGVWIALDEATTENGCMRVLSGGHHDGPRLHFAKRDWQICDTEMAGVKPVAVPLRPGGLMLFDGLLPHGTPNNQSEKRRRALQYHYTGQSMKKWSKEERMAIFGSEGKDVSC